VPTASTASILDANAVRLIQVQLATLSWLDAVYGIAEVAEMKTDDGGIERFPRVYSNLSTTPKQYTDVRYDDTLKAQIFFERDGLSVIDAEADTITHSLAIVCWANLNKVDSGRAYDFTEMLAGSVYKCLRDNFAAEINDQMTMELRSDQVYSKYTMSDVENRFITLPYTAFRIGFTYTEFASGACYEFTAIGNSPC
jgi:hypothetical protein